MEVPYYSIEFFIRRNKLDTSKDFFSFEKIFERKIGLNENNFDWYSEYGVKELTKNRFYAIEYYNAFLNYRIGQRKFFGDWDEKKLLPLIISKNLKVEDVWAAVFLNIGDNNIEPTNKIEISGCFDRGKNQFWKLNEELGYITKFTGETFRSQLPFYYFGYPNDIEILLQNNPEAYKIAYDINIQVTDCNTREILININQTFESIESLQNRKLALTFLNGFYSCFYKLCYVDRHYKGSDGKTIVEPSKTSKFVFQDRECNLTRTLSASVKSLFGFSDTRKTELNDSAFEKKVDIANDFDKKKNIINALVSELEIYEHTGQQRETEEVFIGEIGELSSYKKNELGILQFDPYNIYFRPDKRITYQVLQGSTGLIDGI